jgi:hypothetical protein
MTNKLVTAIFDGEMDADLDMITSAVRDRRATIARRGLVGIKIGDKVRFSSVTRPAYLRGLMATVKKVNGASVVVDVENDPAYGRFSGHRNVRVPASLVERM